MHKYVLPWNFTMCCQNLGQAKKVSFWYQLALATIQQTTVAREEKIVQHCPAVLKEEAKSGSARPCVVCIETGNKASAMRLSGTRFSH
jgi:hypothetical protein